MSEYAPPNIAPQDDGSGTVPEPTRDAPEPVPITEQEVGEYREQDRFLPVSESSADVFLELEYLYLLFLLYYSRSQMSLAS